MRRFAQISVFGVLLISIISGCNGGKADGLGKDDLCVVKVADKNIKVCYGDTRETAEKVLGSGTKQQFGTEYDNGITIMYRGDVVAGITMDEDAKGSFRTSRGAEIGMTKDAVMELYGKKGIENSGNTLDYNYDTGAKRFLDVESLSNYKVDESVYVVSITYGDDGVERIMLLDRKMAITLS